MDELYQENILELYKHPLNKKKLSNPSLVCDGVNPACGDSVVIEMLFEDGKVVDVGHQGDGCAISQAGISLLTEAVKGKTKEEIAAIGEEEMKKMLGIEISHTRDKCAMLGLSAVQSKLL